VLPSVGEDAGSFHFGDGNQSFWKSAAFGKKPFTDLSCLDHETRAYRAKIDFTPEGGFQGDFIMCIIFVFNEDFSAISKGFVKNYGEYGQPTEMTLLGDAPYNYVEIRNNFDKKVEKEAEPEKSNATSDLPAEKESSFSSALSFVREKTYSLFQGVKKIPKAVLSFLPEKKQWAHKAYV
jgi:hypothetical protein